MGLKVKFTVSASPCGKLTPGSSSTPHPSGGCIQPYVLACARVFNPTPNPELILFQLWPPSIKLDDC